MSRTEDAFVWTCDWCGRTHKNHGFGILPHDWVSFTGDTYPQRLLQRWLSREGYPRAWRRIYEDAVDLCKDCVDRRRSALREAKAEARGAS